MEFVQIIECHADRHESAMRNPNLPETGEFGRKQQARSTRR
jgi:hypothetical protein